MPTAREDIVRLVCYAGSPPVVQPALRASISLSLDLSGRSTARWNIRAQDPAAVPAVGDPVEIRAVRTGQPDTVLFGGAVEKKRLVLQRQLPNGPALVMMTATDHRRAADRRLVSDRYENMTMRAIVDAIRAEYLADQGITLAPGPDGPTIDVISWSYVSAGRAIEEVVSAGGYRWRINSQKQIVIYVRASEVSTWTTGTSRRPWQTIEVTEDILQFRNVQYVRGGRARLDRTERIRGDGETRTFPLGLPISENRDSPPRVTFGGTTESAVVRGEGVGNWYYRPGGSEIVRADGASVPGAAQTVEVAYEGTYPVLVRREQSPGEIGVFEHVVAETTLDDETQANSHATALLDRYGVPTTGLALTTLEAGLEVGQEVPINEPAIGINGTFVVDRLAVSDDGQVGALWKASLVDTAPGRWREFWTDTRRLVEGLAIREGEVLQEIVDLADPFEMADVVVVQDASALGRVGTDHVGTALVSQ